MALVMKSICLVVIAAHSFLGTYATQLAGSPYGFNAACAYVVCQNGGECHSVGGDAAFCLCPPGFTGQSCEQKLCPTPPCPSVDPCGGCQNGGGCDIGQEWKYKCFCRSGFTGSRCELKMEPSTTQPSPPDGFNACAYVVCQNGGLCYSVGGDAAVCSCRFGFTGSHCEEVLDPCLTRPCPSGQECVREVFSSRYYCRPVTTRAPPVTPRIAPLSSYPKKNDAHVAKPLLGILHFIFVANSFFIFFHVM